MAATCEVLRLGGLMQVPLYMDATDSTNDCNLSGVASGGADGLLYLHL